MVKKHNYLIWIILSILLLLAIFYLGQHNEAGSIKVDMSITAYTNSPRGYVNNTKTLSVDGTNYFINEVSFK
jgi:hypothetical protein